MLVNRTIHKVAARSSISRSITTLINFNNCNSNSNNNSRYISRQKSTKVEGYGNDSLYIISEVPAVQNTSYPYALSFLDDSIQLKSEHIIGWLKKGTHIHTST